MGANRRQFTREFKLEAVQLLEEAGGDVKAISQQLGVRSDTLRRWRREASGEAGLASGAVAARVGERSSKDEEIRQLRRENEVLKQEREFLKKAAAYFAKHHE